MRKRRSDAKLTQADADFIRGASKYLTQAVLARLFNVSPALVSQIISGQRWTTGKEPRAREWGLTLKGRLAA